MRAFYHPDQALHDPQQYMQIGRVVAPKDLPVRTEKLIGALTARDIAIEQPHEVGPDAIRAVHAPYYIDFLMSAWDRWSALPVHGVEVWPNTFPYWNGRPEEAARPPCPADSIIAQTGWYLGDLSVPMGPHTWLSALRAAETAISAAEVIARGGRSAYALCRPSGHHTRSDRGSGFCYLNNAAIAAQHLRNTFPRVAILDVDAHHGDGTQQIFYHRADVLTISVHADPLNYYPFFTGYAHETGLGDGAYFNLNLPLQPGSTGDAMATAIDVALERIRAFDAQVLIVALGYDAHRLDPIGVLKLEVEDFGKIGAQIRAAGLPTLIVQEGGYAIDVIGDCLGAFLDGLGG
ncbi:histone deacetylase family protein [Methylovirgula sp. 4M-Z18]|uniref:histone deacetylase family protein n=1 Tax=Methylovirgula sp. 4M-Z18 TaxID=2293567 RepID=UPI000E2F1751|nr:histone deacetylase family protein [Methylovirgula sp. 4M-Z18]RFB78435.1 histone deacetylase family protein [Methylovirgula sp. 4M-Z18]